MRTAWSHELARADPGPNLRLEDYIGKPPSTALVQEKINITQCDLGRVVRGARLEPSNLSLWQDIVILGCFPERHRVDIARP